MEWRFFATNRGPAYPAPSASAVLPGRRSGLIAFGIPQPTVAYVAFNGVQHVFQHLRPFPCQVRQSEVGTHRKYSAVLLLFVLRRIQSGDLRVAEREPRSRRGSDLLCSYRIASRLLKELPIGPVEIIIRAFVLVVTALGQIGLRLRRFVTICKRLFALLLTRKEETKTNATAPDANPIERPPFES